jgi:hypothetical protein
MLNAESGTVPNGADARRFDNVSPCANAFQRRIVAA